MKTNRHFISTQQSLRQQQHDEAAVDRCGVDLPFDLYIFVARVCAVVFYY